uniref:EF-hand domain-containing protein n=1 Tax=Acrobeloides nanus TaxID=290746 RepID=A0A914C6W0_9BILA
MDEFLKWHTQISKEPNLFKSQRLFHSYDTNVDRVLSVSEFVPLAYTISKSSNSIGEQLFKAEAENSNEQVSKEITAGIFELADMNNDGKNSNEQVSKVITAGIFELADMNNDGKVALKEFLAVVDTGRTDSNELNQNRGIAQSLIVSIDRNNDEKLDHDEIRIFANQYNKVSEKEIRTVFEILDENRDGLIELKELQKLPLKVITLAGIHAMPKV